MSDCEPVTEFHVGDRVRIRGTTAIGVISRVDGTGNVTDRRTGLATIGYQVGLGGASPVFLATELEPAADPASDGGAC